jgi:hypothetical protein
MADERFADTLFAQARSADARSGTHPADRRLPVEDMTDECTTASVLLAK